MGTSIYLLEKNDFCGRFESLLQLALVLYYSRQATLGDGILRRKRRFCEATTLEVVDYLHLPGQRKRIVWSFLRCHRMLASLRNVAYDTARGQKPPHKARQSQRKLETAEDGNRKISWTRGVGTVMPTAIVLRMPK